MCIDLDYKAAQFLSRFPLESQTVITAQQKRKPVAKQEERNSMVDARVSPVPFCTASVYVTWMEHFRNVSDLSDIFIC